MGLLQVTNCIHTHQYTDNYTDINTYRFTHLYLYIDIPIYVIYTLVYTLYTFVYKDQTLPKVGVDQERCGTKNIVVTAGCW
jgi:hypothetical protein